MKHISSLILGAAVLLSLLPVRAFSIDIDYGYDTGRDILRGGYFAGRNHTLSARQRAYAYSQGGSQVVFVPTSFYQDRDKVIAYNYRPIFAGALYAREIRAADYMRLAYSERASVDRAAVSRQTATPHRQPAASFRTNRDIADFRTVYLRQGSQASVEKKQPSDERPPVGKGSKEDGGKDRDYNSGPR